MMPLRIDSLLTRMTIRYSKVLKCLYISSFGYVLSFYISCFGGVIPRQYIIFETRSIFTPAGDYYAKKTLKSEIWRR